MPHRQKPPPPPEDTLPDTPREVDDTDRPPPMLPMGLVSNRTQEEILERIERSHQQRLDAGISIESKVDACISDVRRLDAKLGRISESLGEMQKSISTHGKLASDNANRLFDIESGVAQMKESLDEISAQVVIIIADLSRASHHNASTKVAIQRGVEHDSKQDLALEKAQSDVVLARQQVALVEAARQKDAAELAATKAKLAATEKRVDGHDAKLALRGMLVGALLIAVPLLLKMLLGGHAP